MSIAHLPQAVRQALRTRLLTVAGLPAARSWENRKFDRPTGAPWIRESYLPAGAALRGLPAWAGEIETQGLYVIGLFWPMDVGTEAPDAVAGAIAAAFPCALQLPAIDPEDSATRLALVTIVSALRIPALSDAPWYHVPVRVRWTAESPNPLPEVA